MESQKDMSLQDELARLRKEIDKLLEEKLLQGDEIRALKAEACSYQEELRSLSSKVQSLEGEASLVGNVGKEVRLRYLERYRQRMGRSIGKLGYDRIRCGDRAAHRGRPVVDSMLCLTGYMADREVYPNLYGVRPETVEKWKDVPEMIEITGFRASLQSEGRLTNEFQAPFERFIEMASIYLSSTELKEGFKVNKTLQQLHGELQDCYDRIVAANARG